MLHLPFQSTVLTMKTWAHATLFAGLFALALALAGCGGGGGNDSPPGTVLPTITVRAPNDGNLYGSFAGKGHRLGHHRSVPVDMCGTEQTSAAASANLPITWLSGVGSRSRRLAFHETIVSLNRLRKGPRHGRRAAGIPPAHGRDHRVRPNRSVGSRRA
jgi:hypothetical protein